MRRGAIAALLAIILSAPTAWAAGGAQPMVIEQSSMPMTISHIASTLHVAGTVFSTQMGTWTVSHVSSVTHATITRDMTGSKGQQVCHSQANFVTTANAIVVHGAAGARLYICGIVLSYATVTVSLVEGTGVACGTGTAAVVGGTTAAYGLVAGSFVMVASRPWISTQTAGNPLCVLTSANTPRVVGVITYGAY